MALPINAGVVRYGLGRDRRHRVRSRALNDRREFARTPGGVGAGLQTTCQRRACLAAEQHHESSDNPDSLTTDGGVGWARVSEGLGEGPTSRSRWRLAEVGRRGGMGRGARVAGRRFRRGERCRKIFYSYGLAARWAAELEGDRTTVVHITGRSLAANRVWQGLGRLDGCGGPNGPEAEPVTGLRFNCDR